MLGIFLLSREKMFSTDEYRHDSEVLFCNIKAFVIKYLSGSCSLMLHTLLTDCESIMILFSLNNVTGMPYCMWSKSPKDYKICFVVIYADECSYCLCCLLEGYFNTQADDLFLELVSMYLMKDNFFKSISSSKCK